MSAPAGDRQLLSFALIVCSLIAGAEMMVLQPLRERAQAADSAAQAAQAAVQQHGGGQTRLRDGLLRHAERIGVALEVAEQGCAVDTDPLATYERTMRTAEALGVGISRMEPIGGAKHDPEDAALRLDRYRLDAAGSFDAIASLISSIELGAEPARVESVSVSPDQDPAVDRVALSMTIVFVRGELPEGWRETLASVREGEPG